MDRERSGDIACSLQIGAPTPERNMPYRQLMFVGLRVRYLQNAKGCRRWFATSPIVWRVLSDNGAQDLVAHVNARALRCQHNLYM